LPSLYWYSSVLSSTSIQSVTEKMFVAKELRKNSIAEYLLYMWQMEDLIRVYGCSLPVIKREYINKFDFTEEQKEEELDWIGNLIRMMNEEGKREYGHLQINEVLLKDVCDLHHRLLQSSKFPFYNAAYYKALPFIVELRNKGDKDINEIETCLDALYGIMMLRLQKKAISPETEKAIKEITTLVGLLSDYYIKDNTEGLKFEDD
jgi:flagellin-specific chaperone FliS